MNSFRLIHSEYNPVTKAYDWSSKRVYGGILIITVCLAVLYSLYRSADVVKALTQLEQIIIAMLWTGTALVGLGTVEKIVKSTKGNSADQQNTPPQEQ